MIYDSVFISDVHLGTERCNTEVFLKFLKQLKTKKLVLVGDIIDIACMENHGTRWKKEHTEAVHLILKLVKEGTELVYVLGNHEGAIRRYKGFSINNFRMVNEHIHIDSKGNKFLCTHGDMNSRYSSGSWRQLIFNKGYELVSPISYFLERHFKFSLIYMLKNSIKGKNFIDGYERDISDYCRSFNGLSGVICGHIHHPNIRSFGDLTYMCCGDFVDSCSVIVEKDGIYEIKKY